MDDFRQICGNSADTHKIPPEGIITEQFGSGKGTAHFSGLLKDQVLGNKGLESGEMIEQENVPFFKLVREVMDLDVDFEKSAKDIEDKPGPFVIFLADYEIIPGYHAGDILSRDLPNLLELQHF
jgi:hypothetical protein